MNKDAWLALQAMETSVGFVWRIGFLSWLIDTFFYLASNVSFLS
jgi:hypothetical protein